MTTILPVVASLLWDAVSANNFALVHIVINGLVHLLGTLPGSA